MAEAQESQEEVQLCLACGEQPATTTKGTVPLCERCAALATDSRGVRYEEKTPEEKQPD